MNYKIETLNLILLNDGKWSWYQLERGLTAKGLGGQFDTSKVIKDLLAEELIKEIYNEKSLHPLYVITEKGKDSLL